MTEKLILPKDKISIGVRADYFQNDGILSKGFFVKSFSPEFNQPAFWAKAAVNLANEILNAHGVDSSLQVVIYAPKTENNEEILTYNGDIKFEIQ